MSYFSFLLKSISGIRGTIGGNTGKGLTPVDIVKFTAAFGKFILDKHPGQRCRIAVGRDARVSGQMVQDLVVSTLVGMGMDVSVLGLSTTPTVEVAVTARISFQCLPQRQVALIVLHPLSEQLHAV